MRPARYRAAPPRVAFVPNELYVGLFLAGLAGAANCAPRKSMRTPELRPWVLHGSESGCRLP